MELVEGEDLSAVIERGPVPLAEAIAIARRIADALEAAHESGIIHRDLKPANIKVRADGTVKVLDFGLAKAMSPDGTSEGLRYNAHSPTLTSPAMTHAGVILGTAAYMAPEQARGKSVDRRADIWAFGAVLYEMLTGRRPFGGETMTDALSAIVSREPDWTALPSDANRVVGPLLRRCLEKDLRKRLQSIGEARIALESPPSPAAAPVAVRRGITIGVAASMALTALAAGVLGTWALTRSASPPPAAKEAHLSMPIGPVPALAGGFVLSPDGTQLAFVGQRAGTNALFLRPLASDVATLVPGTEGAALVGAAFSPDGRWLVFSTAGPVRLKKVPLDGGPAVVLAEGAASTQSRPAWGADGTIVFSDATRALARVPATGGQPLVVSVLDREREEIAHEMPFLLPDGKTVLYSVRRSTSLDATEIVAQSLTTGERRVLFSGVVLGLVGDDRLIVAREGMVLSVPFDTATVQATGPPKPFVADILSAARGLSSVPQFTIARNGTAAYLTTVNDDVIPPMMIVDRKGASTRIAAPVHQYSDPRVSPDGRRIAVHIFEAGRDNWVLDLRTGAFMRLTFDPGEDETPVWSHDGKWIFWTSTRDKVARGIYRKASDGNGAEQLIWSGDRHLHIGGATPDGATLVVSVMQPQHVHVAAIRIADGTMTPLVTTPFSNVNPALSPDGRWIAYASDESGSSEVYVHAFPSMQGRTQVSAGGGAEPVWARNGRELFYRGKEKLMSVAYSTVAGFEAEAPQPLFDDRMGNAQGAGHTGYDATPDGKLVMVARPSTGLPPTVHLKVVFRP
jgi:serine/threonine-protein kinase